MKGRAWLSQNPSKVLISDHKREHKTQRHRESRDVVLLQAEETQIRLRLKNPERDFIPDTARQVRGFVTQSTKSLRTQHSHVPKEVATERR